MTYTGEKKRKYDREWVRARRTYYTLKHGPCSKCASWDRLEFHHINPETKLPALRVSNHLFSMSPAKIEAELEKCVVLCHNCHKEETRRQRLEKNPLVHGTRRYYKLGCRCVECKKASAKYHYDLRQRKLMGQ